MYKAILFLLSLSVSLFAYDFKVTVKWDEMAVNGEAEAILQYYHDGHIEAVRGNLNKPSSDGNVHVNKTFAGGAQEFIIENAAGKLFNVWVVNALMDEDFAVDEDYLMLSESKAVVYVEDNVNQQTYQVPVPEKKPGLAFRGGAIVDAIFYPFAEMFKTQRLYKVEMVHALTGQKLAGVNIIIKNKATGETAAMGQTDENGIFSQKMEYGNYDVLFTKKGFLAGKHEFKMDITELPVSMNFALTPQVNEFRIVLTWGAFPKDLDAHLAGPDPDGGNFHIWWRNKKMIGGRNFLDVDDKNAYGPETITIYKPAKGTYHYAVHNFSGRGRSGKKDLSFSDAHVDVYANGRLMADFDIPRGQKGNVWQVFDILPNQSIVPQNRMYDAVQSASVIR